MTTSYGPKAWWPLWQVLASYCTWASEPQSRCLYWQKPGREYRNSLWWSACMIEMRVMTASWLANHSVVWGSGSGGLYYTIQELIALPFHFWYPNVSTRPPPLRLSALHLPILVIRLPVGNLYAIKVNCGLQRLAVMFVTLFYINKAALLSVN